MPSKVLIVVIILAAITALIVIIVFWSPSARQRLRPRPRPRPKLDDHVEPFTTTPTTTEPVFEDALYDVGIDIADMTGPAVEIAFGGDVPEGPEPEDHINSTVSFIPPVVADNAGLEHSFGDVLEQPPPKVRRGETVSVKYVGANPRNDLMHESTFFVVERQELGEWTVVATVADWETKFTWTRLSTLLGTSSVTIEWDVPLDAVQGSHRITYYGAYRSILGSITHFSGQSNVFNVDDSAVSSN